MSLFNSVPRSLYDEAVADRKAVEVELRALVKASVPLYVHEGVVIQMERQIEALRLHYDHYVAREVHDTIVASLREQLETANEAVRVGHDQLTAVWQEVFAMKRHELLMPQIGDSSNADPMADLGPRTQMAIDEWAAGHADVRNDLIRQAHLLKATLSLNIDDDDRLDAELARLIMEGEG